MHHRWARGWAGESPFLKRMYYITIRFITIIIKISGWKSCVLSRTVDLTKHLSLLIMLAPWPLVVKRLQRLNMLMTVANRYSKSLAVVALLLIVIVIYTRILLLTQEQIGSSTYETQVYRTFNQFEFAEHPHGGSTSPIMTEFFAYYIAQFLQRSCTAHSRFPLKARPKRLPQGLEVRGWVLQLHLIVRPTWLPIKTYF